MQKLGQPIADRYKESEERPGAFNELGGVLQLVRKAVDSYEAKEEKYAHIEAADMEKVSKCLEEKSAWFNSNMNQCSQIKPHQNPPVTAAQVRAQKAVSIHQYKNIYLN